MMNRLGVVWSGVVWAGCLCGPAPLRAQSVPYDGVRDSLRAVVKAPDAAAPAVRAHRVASSDIRLDGVLDEEAWAKPPVATGFVQLDPEEGAPASERTEARVLYAEDALYVGVRAWDSEADSIVGQLTRRDQHSYSDRIHVIVDSYHDRRTAFQFVVNPLGVKQDLYRFDDTSQDFGWDAVWDVATRVDDQGWTTEFRIPYSQLRFNGDDDPIWGINFVRDIARRNETVTWAPISKQESGFVSRFGELQGLERLNAPRRLEILPYAVSRVVRAPGDTEDPFYDPTDLSKDFGADIKYGLTSDLTLDLTINPDFGQVEADPAQVNLSAFETFLPERRPFFLEGAGIFRFGLNQGDGDGANQSLFYSRRIGRPPQGSADIRGGFVDSPDNTTIHTAAKLSGKTAGGWSIGVLHALTSEEDASIVADDGTPYEDPVEPVTHYSLTRVQRDFQDGKSAVGAIVTGTWRDSGVAEDLELRERAFTGGVDIRHRFGGDNYLIRGYLLGSQVRGSPEAILNTQRSSARYFQRPDADHVSLDPTRTGLGGWSTDVSFSKVGGGFWRYATGFQARSPGFEVNDLGFMTETDYLNQWLWIGYQHSEPTEHFQRYNLNFNSWGSWDFGGLRLGRGGNVNGSFTLRNYWGGYAGVNRSFEGFSTGLLRGGPAFLAEASWNGWVGMFSDSRKAVQLNLNGNWGVRPDSDSRSWWWGGNVRWRPSGRATLSVGPFLSLNTNDRQWVGRITASDDSEHYVFGRIDQRTVGVTTRLDFAFTPDLSLQIYAQPFVSAATYDDFKRVADPRARSYDDRFQLLSTTAVDDGDAFEVELDGDGTAERFHKPDFNFKQFRSNVVLRWEYRPGSTVFLVWSQARDHTSDSGDFRFRRGLDRLFEEAGENVFMVKASWWLSP